MLSSESEPLLAVRPDIAPWFADVIGRGLQIAPAERFADAGELAAALA